VGFGNSGRSCTAPPFRQASEDAGSNLTIRPESPFAAPGRGESQARAPPRGSLTFFVDLPARMAAEELVFDIDQIEIVKT